MPLKRGLWDPSWRLTTDLCPIIKFSLNLGALSSFLLFQSFKCLLPMLLLFLLSPASRKILFQNVSQPSANGIRSCLTVTKSPGSRPKGPPVASSVPRWPPSPHDVRKHFRAALQTEKLIRYFFSRDREKKMLWIRKSLVGHWPGLWDLNSEQLIWG